MGFRLSEVHGPDANPCHVDLRLVGKNLGDALKNLRHRLLG
jgi:hypothetical protein